MRSAHLDGADLSGADLSGADLRDAILCEADLSGADLRNADLRNTSLCEADLSGALLSGAGFLYANLRGANLNDADLSGADLSGSVGGPAYYSISWIGHGECGRRLHAVEQNGELVFSCGCFSGSESDLLEYIETGDKAYITSRLEALDIILGLHERTRGRGA